MSPCFCWPRRRPDHRIALDHLPYDVLKEILQYLPFNQRVRIARVNRRLQVISEITISQTKTFHMTAPCFRRITMKSMANLIESCAASMENLIIQVDTIRQHTVLPEQLQLLWGLPRLTTIILETGHVTSSLFGRIQESLVKIPSLRSLKWEDTSCGFDDTQQMVAYDSLERADLKVVYYTNSVHGFTSFLNNCSSLKHLALRERAVECVATMNRMDSVESLIYDNSCYSHSEQLLEMIPVSFPQLVNLEMRLWCPCASDRVVNEEVEWLETLTNLRNIKIEYYHGCDDYYSKADVLLTRCKSLQIAEFHRHLLNPTTVLDFTRHCSQLRKLTIRDISGIDSATAATAFVLSLADFVQQNLTIVLEKGDSNVWQCAEVEMALNEINQRVWRRLSIEVANVDSKRLGEAVDPWEWKEPVEVVPASEARKSRCQKMISRILGAFRPSKQ